MKVALRIYNIVALVYIFFMLSFLASFGLSQLYSIQLIGDKDVYVNVGTKYFENGCNTKFASMKVDKITIKNNVDTSKVGKYKVLYNKKFLIFNVNKYRNVYVIDKEKPVITLNGDTYMYLRENENYSELGYSAIDNVDGNITENVQIESNLDTSKIGKYTINYRIKDSSGNESNIDRNIEVIESNLLTTGIQEFRMTNYFKDVILQYEDKEYDYLKDTIFLGDCNTVFLNTKGYHLNEHQTWGQFNLNISQINHSTFSTFENHAITNLDNAINTYHPKYLVVNMGLNTANYMNKDDVIREIDYLIENMKNNHPDVKLIFSSIVPVRQYGTADGIYSMNRINSYNYYTVLECQKYHIPFIDYTDVIKNSLGFGDDYYLYCTEENDCGFHLSEEGRAAYIEYVKHLNFERN